VYNLGTGKGQSVLEMVEAFKKATGVTVRNFSLISAARKTNFSFYVVYFICVFNDIYKSAKSCCSLDSLQNL